jgi:hypothetical protein
MSLKNTLKQKKKMLEVRLKDRMLAWQTQSLSSNSSTDQKEIKTRINIRSSSSTSGHKLTLKAGSQRDICGSIMHNSHEVEAIHLDINR